MRSLATLNLSGSVIALVIVLSRIVPPWVQKAYQIQDPEPTWSELALRDPKPGTLVPSLKGRSPAVLLVVSDCGDCNRAKVFTFAASDVPKGVRRFVLVENVPTLEGIEERFGKHERISYLPLDAKLKKDLNVSFTPRAYLLDRSKMIRYVQPPSMSYGQALWSARRMLDEGL